jgi:predicted Zn-dependent protease
MLHERALVFTCAMVSLLSACAYESPYVRRERLQAGEVNRLSAASIRAQDARWRAMRTVQIDVYATRAYHRDAVDWQTQLDQRISDANAVLKSFSVQLELGRVEDWQAKQSHDDLDIALKELESMTQQSDAAFVLGLVGPMPYAIESYAQIGRARLLNRHMVMRQMDSVEEMQSFRQHLDMIDEEEILRLYRGRKRHKEASVLLHELGHTLGAIHDSDRASFMHASYDSKGQAFSEPNQQIMAHALADRLKAPEERDSAALVDWMIGYLESLQGGSFRQEDLAAHLGELRSAAQQLASARENAAAASAEPKVALAAGAGTSATPPTAIEAANDPRSDVSELSATDRERFAGARAASADNRLLDAWKPLRALAANYPKNYAVQHLACDVAMRGSLPMREVQKYCDRLAKLAGFTGAKP